MRALIIDDVKTDRVVASAYLERLGFEILVASNGNDAIELFEKFDFSVLVTDYRMPSMTGDILISRIRAIEKERKLKPVHIISFSTEVSSDMKSDLLSAGSNEVLQKPIRLENIRNSLASIMQVVVVR